jgi:hypothetical protein
MLIHHSDAGDAKASRWALIVKYYQELIMGDQKGEKSRTAYRIQKNSFVLGRGREFVHMSSSEFHSILQTFPRSLNRDQGSWIR